MKPLTGVMFGLKLLLITEFTDSAEIDPRFNQIQKILEEADQMRDLQEIDSSIRDNVDHDYKPSNAYIYGSISWKNNLESAPHSESSAEVQNKRHEEKLIGLESKNEYQFYNEVGAKFERRAQKYSTATHLSPTTPRISRTIEDEEMEDKMTSETIPVPQPVPQPVPLLVEKYIPVPLIIQHSVAYPMFPIPMQSQPANPLAGLIISQATNNEPMFVEAYGDKFPLNMQNKIYRNFKD